MVITPFVISKHQHWTLVRVIVPLRDFVFIVVLELIRCQISVFIPTFKLPGELRIIHYNYRKQLVLAKLAWYILEICNKLLICLIFNLCLSLISLSDGLFGQACCIVTIKGHFVAEDETVCSL